MKDPPPPPKFGVYESVAITSALSRQTITRKPWHFPFIFTLFCASLWFAWNFNYRVEGLIALVQWIGVTRRIAGMLVHTVQWMVITVFLLTTSALVKVFNLPSTSLSVTSGAKIKPRVGAGLPQSPSSSLVELQRRPALVPRPGLAPKKWYDTATQLASPTQQWQQQPPRPHASPSQASSPLLVPLHPQVMKSSRSPIGSQWNGRSVLSDSMESSGTVTSASLAPPLSGSPSPYRAPPRAATPGSQSSSPVTGFRSKDRNQCGRLEFGKEEVDTEEKLAEFLAEVDNKLASGSVKSPWLSTPPPTVQGLSGGPTPTAASSNPRSALRVLRLSPSAPKTGSPKKGEMEMPLPMSIEQVTEVFKRLGVYSHIERWRDGLRQWFSDVLLNPLVRKIDTSHVQAMAAAAKLGITLSVAQIGGSKQDAELTPISSEGSQQEWLTTMVSDEDSFLHQLRAMLMHACNGPASMQNSLFGLAPAQERVYNPHIQVCLDAVTEHQRLKALMKGEWVKGLLPQASVRADYTVQRIRDLAEGTCVKAYEFWPNGEVYERNSKRWTSELPSDAHVLVYLFCSLLEHPQWMLHVDPTSHPSTQSGNNSLFVAGLPHKERYPEKYIAIISGAPSVLHAGAIVLAVGKSSPPVFALYWEKKLQFSSQGRSALWDAILLLCYRVKVAHGGVVRGINLGSPAFNLLPVLEPVVESPAR